MKKLVLCSLALLALPTAQAKQAPSTGTQDDASIKLNMIHPPLRPSFIITPEATKPTKRSKNKLKESIGGSLQEVMHRCALLAHTLGKLQMQLAQIQSHLVTSARTLVEDSGSIGKASKSQLTQGLEQLKQAEASLHAHNQSVTQLNKALRATPVFKAA